MKHWSNYAILNYSNSLHRIYSSMRSNKILRGLCYYKSILSNSIRWDRASRMNLRWIRCRQSNTKSILRTTLRPSICTSSCSMHSHYIPSPNRFKQPTRYRLRLRTNPIPCILFHKRRTRICNRPIHIPSSTNICSKYIYRPRKLH